jgi:hypothetical protein
VETQEVGGHDENSSNPMAGCRMKQICSAVRGESRRSREERHGRKVLCAWQHRAEGKPSRGTTGTGREQCMSAEGHSLENHKRGSSTELLESETDRKVRHASNRTEEPHEPDRVFEDEVKDRRL